MRRLLFSFVGGFALGISLLACAGVLMSRCDADNTWGVLAGRAFDAVNKPLAILFRDTDVERAIQAGQAPEQAVLLLGLWWGCLGIVLVLIIRAVLGIGRRKE